MSNTFHENNQTSSIHTQKKVVSFYYRKSPLIIKFQKYHYHYTGIGRPQLNHKEKTMNIIGIRFQIPNEYGNILEKLLKNELSEDSFWRRGEHEEILTFSSNSLITADNDLFTNLEIRKYLKPKPYYPIFFTFSVYFKEQLSYPSIKSIRDFLSSNCDFVVAVIDACELIILSKEQKRIDKILNLSNSYKHNYIYENQEMDLD